jgi:hypothetical protein
VDLVSPGATYRLDGVLDSIEDRRDVLVHCCLVDAK